MKTFYIARDLNPYLLDGVAFSEKPPKLEEYKDRKFYPNHNFGNVEYSDFLRVIGVRLRPGEIKKVRMVEAR